MNKQSDSLSEQMHIDSDEQRSRKVFIDFTDNDIALLKELKPVVAAHAARVVDVFYKNIQDYPELMRIIDKAGSNIDRLKQAQKRYLLEMFEGDYGTAYVDRRLRIGEVHNQIGLTPRWYIGSYSVYVQEIVPLINKKYRFKPARRQQATLAVNKIISFDSQLAMDTYIHGLMEDLGSVSMSKDIIDNSVIAYRDFIGKVASGDLRERLEVSGDDDLSQLGSHLNDMTENLGTITNQMREVGSSITSTVSELDASVTAQSSGTAEQAAAVNQTTATLEEIRQTSTQTLDKAQTLGQSAERTRKESSQGLAAVQEAIEGMAAISSKVDDIAQTILALSEQTQQIGEITEVVNSLAQQSKMLALNASIEAAKAGDAGKGFAVVADEVKDLAEQSQQSTAQVQKILQDIRHATDRAVMATEEGSKGVDRGVLLVERSGDVMRTLSEVIQETVTSSQQIVAAVRQEAAGIDQVNTAMGEINKVTQQFVSTAEQTQQASRDIARLASEMGKVVSVYKT
ncbi:MAG: HAMP domain-containing protein [Gammaproteobacteria bacterium]|nr:HAMP domain-containing protein [Gammaproteobacteria bacterium]